MNQENKPLRNKNDRVLGTDVQKHINQIQILGMKLRLLGCERLVNINEEDKKSIEFDNYNQPEVIPTQLEESKCETLLKQDSDVE